MLFYLVPVVCTWLSLSPCLRDPCWGRGDSEVSSPCHRSSILHPVREVGNVATPPSGGLSPCGDNPSMLLMCSPLLLWNTLCIYTWNVSYNLKIISLKWRDGRTWEIGAYPISLHVWFYQCWAGLVYQSCYDVMGWVCYNLCAVEAGVQYSFTLCLAQRKALHDLQQPATLFGSTPKPSSLCCWLACAPPIMQCCLLVFDCQCFFKWVPSQVQWAGMTLREKEEERKMTFMVMMCLVWKTGVQHLNVSIWVL